MAWIESGIKYALIGLGGLALVAIYIYLLLRLYHFLLVKKDQKHPIKLSNLGNVRSFYQLAVASPEGKLRFKLTYRGLPLMEVPNTPAKAYAVSTPDSHQTGSQPGTRAFDPSSVDASRLADSGRSTAAKAGALASVLGTLGSLIPGSLGQQLRAQGAAARRVQTKTVGATQAPLRTQQKIQALGHESGKLAKGAPVLAAQTKKPTPIDTHHQPSSYNHIPENPQTRLGYNHYRVQTPEVAPGKTMDLTLEIGTHRRPYPQGSFVYSIQSQQVPVSPAEVEIPPTLTHGTVHFNPVSSWRYWMPFLVCGLITLIVLFAVVHYWPNYQP